MEKNGEGAEVAVGLVGALGIEVGTHVGIELDKRLRRQAIPRSLPTYQSNANGVIVAERPSSGRVWEVRLISVWIIQPLGVQAGSAAIHIGSASDLVSVGNGLNAECEIPSQPLPLFLHLGRGEMIYRNAEVLYAVLSSVASPGFMSINVVEYDETEYFSAVGRLG